MFLLRLFLNCCFHLPSFTDKTQAVPVVISCVRAIVAKSTNRILTHLVSMVLDWQATEECNGTTFKQNVPDFILSKIPKEWNYTTLDRKEKDAPAKSMHKICNILCLTIFPKF